MDEIVTQRLRWRPPLKADAAALRALLSDWEVVRMTGSVPWPADASDIAARCRPAPAAEGLAGHVFAGTGFVGTCSVKATAKGPMLGYLIARDHQGRGFATEIAAALVAAAWATTDWPWLRATVFEDNPASMRVMDKLGFALVEVGTGSSRARGDIALPVRRYRLARP